MKRDLATYCANILDKIIKSVIRDMDERRKKAVFQKIFEDLEIIQALDEVSILKDAQNNFGKDVFEIYKNTLIKRLQTDIVKYWLSLLLGRPELGFKYISLAVENFKSKILEINIKTNNNIDLNENRENLLLNSVIKDVKKEDFQDKDYQYFVLDINGDKSYYTKKDIEEIDITSYKDPKVSKKEVFNILFDYVFTNKD